MLDRKTPTPQKPLRKVRRIDVQPEDLAHLDTLHKILRLLNEPRQSASPLTALVARLPILDARLRHAYRAPQWFTEDAYGEPELNTVMVQLGNAGFERVLFELLEDLTILNAEITGQ